VETIDLQLFKNVIAEGRNNSNLLDSFSPNQFKTKERLIGHIRDLNIVDDKSEITILGGWYGSILIPAFKEAKRISLIDLDKQVVSIAKQRIFNHYNNIDFITSDVFDKNRYGRIRYANLIINTSCEHMKPMKELEALQESNAYFAFTSNNMLSIEGHINCVYDLNDFEKQMPDNAKVLVRDSITDERGTRFMLIGKFYEKSNL
jgi:hypothetical protein|tara:strand:+ start:53 stop:664 length:612 start_codon:yes stop_codon:yes gene_type:complete